MNVKVRVKLFWLTLAVFTFLSECATAHDCYKCEDDKLCNNPEKNEPGIDICQSNIGCYTMRTENVTIRGCKKTDVILEKPKGKHGLLRTCVGDMCNKQRIYSCYACNDNTICKDPLKTESADKAYCLGSSLGCYTIRKGDFTTRGCVEDDEQLNNLLEGSELQGTCESDLCNGESKPKDYYTCYKCMDQYGCNHPSRASKIGTEICTKNSAGCYTANFFGDTARGCLDSLKTADYLNDTNLLIQQCTKNKCNDKETYNCFDCKDKEMCSDLSDSRNVSKVVCSQKDHSERGCYTVREFDGKTVRGCAQSHDDMNDLTVNGKLLGICRTDSCNDHRIPRDSYMCHTCIIPEVCDNPSKKYPFGYEFCGMNDRGCYTVVRKDETLRGCAKSNQDLDSLKKGGELLGFCKTSGCNDQTIYDCYYCDGTSKCNDPKLDNIKSYEKCIKGKNAGCYTLNWGHKITRGCSKSTDHFNQLKEKGEIKGPCTSDKCNVESSGTWIPDNGISNKSLQLLPAIFALICAILF